jgi:hypothetical protein
LCFYVQTDKIPNGTTTEMETFLPKDESAINGNVTTYKVTKDNDFEAANAEIDPFKTRVLDHPVTNCDTLTHLLKASLGTGILSMPAAFKASGLVLGIFATIVVSIICTHCAYILVSIQVNPHCWITHFFATDQNCHTMSFQTIINAQKKNLSRSFSFSIYATNFLSFILSLSALGLLSVFIFHNYFGFLLPYVTR